MFFLKNSILNVNSKIKRLAFNGFYDILLNSNLIIIGLRQLGKTTISKQLLKKYAEDHKINFEKVSTLNLQSITHPTKEEIIEQVSAHKFKVLLIDEIQTISDWSSLVQVLVDENPDCKFIFTSSNATSLQKNIAPGRAITVYLNPLSFDEFKTFYKSDNFLEYLKYGSLPKQNDFFSAEFQYKQIGYSLIVDRVLKDDIDKNINKMKFKTFFQNLKNYVGNQVPVTKLDVESNIKVETRKEYLNIVNNAKLIDFISKYNDKNNHTKFKMYFNDKSMLYYLNDFKELNNNDKGALIENLIFNTLDNKYNQKYGFNSIFYFRNNKQQEVDFVIPEAKIIIESKYISDQKILFAEINKLNQIISNEFQDFTKIIVTNDIEIEYKNWKAIPLIKFLKIYG